MSFHTTLFVHVQDATADLLKSCNFTREYYIDRVKAVLYPETINIVAYAKNVDIMEQHLIVHGFTPKITKDSESLTMTYKDIVNIKTMVDKKGYETCKVMNFRIASITLDHVIKQMAKDGFSISQMYTNLGKLATFK